MPCVVRTRTMHRKSCLRRLRSLGFGVPAKSGIRNRCAPAVHAVRVPLCHLVSRSTHNTLPTSRARPLFVSGHVERPQRLGLCVMDACMSRRAVNYSCSAVRLRNPPCATTSSHPLYRAMRAPTQSSHQPSEYGHRTFRSAGILAARSSCRLVARVQLLQWRGDSREPFASNQVDLHASYLDSACRVAHRIPCLGPADTVGTHLK
ncbi:hypothetical protein C8R43DRAFT_1054109 [Mycena crocata]|nr:hypothetical protein C8R43DRAFT_1054109 [Mycena crocata]